MEKTVQAAYENGVLHPLEPLPLGERQQVTVTISDGIDVFANHPLLVSPDEWSHGAQDDIGLGEVRQALATIQGLFRKLSLKSAESADCPDISSTPARWPNFIVMRPAAASSTGFSPSQLPDLRQAIVVGPQERRGDS